MPYTPKQVSCSDQLVANARERLGILLPRMRTLAVDNPGNVEPALATLCRATVDAIAALPTPAQQAEAIANVAMLQTLTCYELAVATPETQPEPLQSAPADPAEVLRQLITRASTAQAQALEQHIRGEITVAVTQALYKHMAANDSGNVRLDTLAKVSVDAMAAYITSHAIEVRP